MNPPQPSDMIVYIILMPELMRPRPSAELARLDEKELLALVKAAPLPRHVAIIMDGNGRWARRRGLPRVAGHREGGKAAKEIVRGAGKLGLGYLTLYAFSSENWSRPATEVRTLMGLLEKTINQELAALVENDVRVCFIGRLDGLGPSTRKEVERAIATTSSCRGLNLVIALNYGSRGELVDAIRAVGGQIQAGTLTPQQIDEALISRHLYTREIPDPDLLIRTSGEFRVSNFLLWQIAYTELWVTPTLWPDFGPRELFLAVAEFQRRERRFGGIQNAAVRVSEE